jgi:hypothetical protein
MSFRSGFSCKCVGVYLQKIPGDTGLSYEETSAIVKNPFLDTNVAMHK